MTEHIHQPRNTDAQGGNSMTINFTDPTMKAPRRCTEFGQPLLEDFGADDLGQYRDDVPEADVVAAQLHVADEVSRLLDEALVLPGDPSAGLPEDHGPEVEVQTPVETAVMRTRTAALLDLDAKANEAHLVLDETNSFLDPWCEDGTHLVVLTDEAIMEIEPMTAEALEARVMRALGRGWGREGYLADAGITEMHPLVGDDYVHPAASVIISHKRHDFTGWRLLDSLVEGSQ